MLINSDQIASRLVATIGTDSIYAELNLGRQGAVLELHVDAVRYDAYTGWYLRDELGREFAESEDEAIDFATDLEYLAFGYLDEFNARGWKDPSGFGEAVEKLFERSYAVAAE